MHTSVNIKHSRVEVRTHIEAVTRMSATLAVYNQPATAHLTKLRFENLRPVCALLINAIAIITTTHFD